MEFFYLFKLMLEMCNVKELCILECNALQSFKIKQKFRKKISLSELFVACLVLISLWAHFSGLKIKAKYRSENAVEFLRYTRRYIYEDRTFLCNAPQIMQPCIKKLDFIMSTVSTVLTHRERMRLRWSQLNMVTIFVGQLKIRKAKDISKRGVK
jgi:hypothetical protein